MSKVGTPSWLAEHLEITIPEEGETVKIGARNYVMRGGILRARHLLSDAELQTATAFGFKWHKRDTFESDASLKRMRAWLVERYGDVATAGWWKDYGSDPLVLD